MSDGTTRGSGTGLIAVAAGLVISAFLVVGAVHGLRYAHPDDGRGDARARARADVIS